jgi:hypothetical protein
VTRASRTFALAISLLLAPGPSSALSAQLVSSLDAGLATVRFRTVPRTSAVLLTPALRLEGSRTVLAATGTLAVFEGGHTSGQGELAASGFAPLIGRLLGEVSLSADGGSFRGTRAGRLLAQGRLRLQGDAIGGWVGGGGGRTRYNSNWHTVTIAEVGAWAAVGAATLTASLSSTSFPLGTPLISAITTAGLERQPQPGLEPLLALAEPPRRDRFLDAATSLTWPLLPKVDVDFVVGARGGTVVTDDEAWGRVNGTVWLSERLAVVAGLGRYPNDPSQNLQAGDYATLTMRFGVRPPRRGVLPSRAAAPALGLVMDVGDNGARTIRLQVPGARLVELMGDFTDWKVIALSHQVDDVWAVTLPIDPGTYRVSIRIDSGAWGAPPGLPAFTDEFSSQVGVLVVK